MRKTTKITCFKVVSSNFRSCRISSNCKWSVKYGIGLTSRPKVAGSGLYVFSSLEGAKAFIAFFTWQDWMQNVHILKGTGTRPRAALAVPFSHVIRAKTKGDFLLLRSTVFLRSPFSGSLQVDSFKGEEIV